MTKWTPIFLHNNRVALPTPQKPFIVEQVSGDVLAVPLRVKDNAYNPGTEWKSMVVVDCPLSHRDTVENYAESVTAALIASEIHEVFEFVKLDGKPIADPHPSNQEAEMINWLYSEALKIVRKYKSRYPNERQ